MIEVEKKSLDNLRKLFKEIRFHMGLSVLDGKMGKAYTDNIEDPKYAILIVRKYCFISGEITSEQLKNIIKEYELYEYTIIPSDKIKRILEKEYKSQIIKFQRYSMKKGTIFNIDKLNKYIDNSNTYTLDYKFVRINQKIADRIKKENFINITDDYKENGIGYCCIYDNDIIGVASSNIIYNDGIEVNVKVQDNFRRKGIATILVSKLILECIKENKTISWDAANLNSVGLATKLGFEYDSPYDTYIIKTPIKCKGQLNTWNYYNELEIMDLMNNIEYGWLDKDDNKHRLVDESFSNNYILQDPNEVITNKIGVCWDQVELERHYFKENAWNIKTYFIVYYDGDKCPTHTFLTYEKNNKFYWFEHSWERFKGIHEYNAEWDLLLDVKDKFIKHELNNQYNVENLALYEYEKPKYHISVQEFYNHCENGKYIDFNTL